jgi:hypothetical protein
MLTGAVLTAGGTFWFSRITEHSTYLGGVLGPMVLTAAGFGLIFVPMTLTGTSGVDRGDAGVAGSLIPTGQQVGGAVGLAALGTVVWTVVAHSITSQLTRAHSHLAGSPAAVVNHALAQGFSRGFLISFAITLLALGVIAGLIRQPCPVTEDQPVPIGCPGYHWRRPRVLALPVLRRETPLRPAGPG